MNYNKMTLKEKGVFLNSFINEDKLISIINLHKMQGDIETGYRYWLMDFFGVFIKEPYLSSYLNELIQHSDRPCMGIIEKKREELNSQIPILAQRIYVLHNLNILGLL